jgi:hypothetical protein
MSDGNFGDFITRERLRAVEFVSEEETGCCTISAPGIPDRDIPGITKAECEAIANRQPGAVAHWVKGECA